MRVLLVFVLVGKNRSKVPINNSCLRSIFVEYLVSPLYCDVSFQRREILLGKNDRWRVNKLIKGEKYWQIFLIL